MGEEALEKKSIIIIVALRNASMAVGKAAGDRVFSPQPQRFSPTKPTRGGGAHEVSLFTYVGCHGAWRSGGAGEKKKTMEVLSR